MHEMGELFAKHKFDKEIDDFYGSKADSAAPATEATLTNMKENIPTIKYWYDKSGKPIMQVQSSVYANDGISEALTFSYSTDNYRSSIISFFKSSFSSFRTLGHNMIHEIGHANYNYLGHTGALVKKYGQYSNKPLSFSEVFAFKFAFQHGGIPYSNNSWYKTSYSNTQ